VFCMGLQTLLDLRDAGAKARLAQGQRGRCDWMHFRAHPQPGVVLAARYYYFGNATSPLITADLAFRAPFAGRSFVFPGLTIEKLVDMFVAVNAYTTYPLLVVVLQVRIRLFLYSYQLQSRMQCCCLLCLTLGRDGQGCTRNVQDGQQ